LACLTQTSSQDELFGRIVTHVTVICVRGSSLSFLSSPTELLRILSNLSNEVKEISVSVRLIVGAAMVSLDDVIH
jgi:hypothetical protein